MSDFNWDDHPVESSRGGFDWGAHPIEAPRPKPLSMGDRDYAQALEGNPAAMGVRQAILHPLDTAKEVLSDPDAPSYQDLVNAAEGAFSDDPEAMEAKRKAQHFSQMMALGNMNIGGPAPGSRVAGEMGAGAAEILGSAGESMGSKAAGFASKALGAERGSLSKINEKDPLRSKKIGRYALDQGIVSPMASTEEMLSRNTATSKAAGKEMGEVFKTIDSQGASTFEPEAVAKKVGDELNPQYRTPINKGEWQQLDNTIESILQRGKGNIPMTEAQALKEEIKAVAYPRGRAPRDASPKQMMAQDAYRIVNEAIDEAAEKGSEIIGVAGLKERLQAAKKLYGLGSFKGGAGELLSNKAAREEGNKKMGLTDWLALGGGMGAGAAHGGASSAIAGAGLLATKRIGEKYGPATAAVTLDKVSKLLSAGGEGLGKYGPILQKSMERGENAFYVTHAMLMQDPDYRATIERNQ